MNKHITVLLNEGVDYLNIKADGIYVDATLGFGGHSSLILEKIPNGKLYAFDKDINAIEFSKERLSKIGNNFKLINTGFINLKSELLKEVPSIDGVIFDLGVSSVEIDDPKRGFSYTKDGPLDMRMNLESSLTAKEVVNTYSKEKLVSIFRKYGEEKHALKIASLICEEREIKPISTTLELVDLIDKCYPYKEKRNSHPAKKVFQALRIEVNNELGEFEKALKDSLEILKPGGRIVVITFHSLEDRICKNIFKEVTKEDELLKGMPNIPKELLPNFKLITKKPIIPSKEELEYNKRSKSAKMRVIEKIK